MLSNSNPPRSARLMAARRIRSLDKAARRFAACLACVAIYLCFTADSIHRKSIQAYAVCGKLTTSGLRCKCGLDVREEGGNHDYDEYPRPIGNNCARRRPRGR